MSKDEFRVMWEYESPRRQMQVCLGRKLGRVTQISNPNTQDDAGGDHCLFKYSLGYIRSSRPAWLTHHTRNGRAEWILCKIKGKTSSVEKLSLCVEKRAGFGRGCLE